MSHTRGSALKKSQKPFIFLVMIGLLGLIATTWIRRKKSQPQGVIHKVLSAAGYSEQTIKYWTSVSAFETAEHGVPWTSQVLHDSNNLFNLIVPGSKKLSYGEGQTIYDTLEQSVHGLIDKVIKPFNYPANYATLDDLIDTMKKHGYFGGNIDDYKAGVHFYFSKLYGNA